MYDTRRPRYRVLIKKKLIKNIDNLLHIFNRFKKPVSFHVTQFIYTISEFQELHSLLPHCFSELQVYCEKPQAEGGWVQAREILIITHKTHTVIRNNSSLRCRNLQVWC